MQNPPSAPPTDIDGVYVAEVSKTPNPRSVVRLDSVIGLRSDDAALLYTDGAQVFEAVIDAGTPGQSLGAGTNGWYDSTGNVVLLQNPLSPARRYLPDRRCRRRFAVRSVRASRWNSSLTTYYVDVSGFSQAAAAIIGQGPATGGAPATARLGIVDALAPTAVYYLTTFQSPLQLSSYASKIVQ